MERCPFCQARLSSADCPRCGADLSLPLHCLAQADYYCQQAILALIDHCALAEAKQFLVQATQQKQSLFSEILIEFIANDSTLIHVVEKQKPDDACFKKHS